MYLCMYQVNVLNKNNMGLVILMNLGITSLEFILFLFFFFFVILTFKIPNLKGTINSLIATKSPFFDT